MIIDRIVCDVKKGTISVDSVDVEVDNSIDYNREIERLKSRLHETDYVVIKIAEGTATHEEYSDIIKERISIRKQINDYERNLK